MTIHDLHEIPLDLIEVGADRARDFDEAGAQLLASAIAAQGLHHPIRVRQSGDRYILVSGLHRLRAFGLLRRETIPVSISIAENDDVARLEEVMENLGRTELIALDRCHHLYELKRTYDLVHPGASHPGRRVNGKSFPILEGEAEIFGLAASIAEKVGLSKRYINLSVKIWTDLTPTSRLRLSGTNLATKQTELKALSEQKPALQAKILDLILGEDQPDIQNVAAALIHLEGGVQPIGDEKRLNALRNSIKDLPEPVFDRLVSENAERMIAALKRTGHI